MSETLDGVLRAEGGKAAVRFEREYPTGVHDLWAALTEPDRIARWFDRVSGDLHAGGRVTVHFDDGPADFEVVTCDPPTTLATRWMHAGASHSVVTARLAPLAPDRTRLVLEHTDLAPSNAADYAAGWHYYLDGLRAVVDDAPRAGWDEHFLPLLAGYRAQVSPQR